MTDVPEDLMILTTKIRVSPSKKNVFIDWQAKLNSIMAVFPGFISLEILSPTKSSQSAWVIVQRFSKPIWLSNWRQSEERLQLMNELKEILGSLHPSDIQESESGSLQMQGGGITEVFVTQIESGMEEAYRKWIAKVHQVEAKFPGFRGVYVQSPSPGQGRSWITLLQFDNQENLDNWLSSPERAQVLRESAPLIAALESHRLVSPYAGWFSSIAREGEVPPTWKQTMIVLLVLYPIIMLELKYLSPLTAHLNSSLATFIGNAISVTLIAWPMMPIAIWFLGWWLSPKGRWKTLATPSGTTLMILLYSIEIMLFWNLL